MYSSFLSFVAWYRTRHSGMLATWCCKNCTNELEFFWRRGKWGVHYPCDLIYCLKGDLYTLVIPAVQQMSQGIIYLIQNKLFLRILQIQIVWNVPRKHVAIGCFERGTFRHKVCVSKTNFVCISEWLMLVVLTSKFSWSHVWFILGKLTWSQLTRKGYCEIKNHLKFYVVGDSCCILSVTKNKNTDMFIYICSAFGDQWLQRTKNWRQYQDSYRMHKGVRMLVMQDSVCDHSNELPGWWVAENFLTGWLTNQFFRKDFETAI
jgi:hypothetical protein